MLTTDALLQIKSKLALYHTACCGLKHERVVEFSSFETGNYFKRYGFCDNSARRYRLGCAHTMANQEFCQVILSMSTQFPGAEALADEFEQLFLNVYAMDVAKGILEKQLTLALSSDKKEFIAEAKSAIAEVIATHHQLIKTIEELRSQLIASLN